MYYGTGNFQPRKPKRRSHFLPFLMTVLILGLSLFASSRTEPGRAFLSYVGEKAENVPFVSGWLESAQDVWHGWFPGDSDAEDSPDVLPVESGGQTVPEADTFESLVLEPVPEIEPVPEAEPASAAEPVQAAEPAPPPDVGTDFPLNHSPYYPQSVQFDGGRLTLRGIPDDEAYQYIMLQVETNGGAEAYKEADRRTADGAVSFPLSSVGEGQYELCMYANTEQYGEYTSFLNLSAENDWTGWKFLPSPVYEATASFARDEGTSAAALSYYLRPSRHIQSDDAQIRQTAAQIVSGLDGAYEKTLAIHDWVSGNLYYDDDVFSGRVESGDCSAVETLSTRRGVCEGYANLTCALLRAAGVPAKVVSGYALGISGGDTFPGGILSGGVESNHAWNEAYVDGRWMILDTTWDSGNKYAYRKITAQDGCTSRRYFDISRAYLAQDHAVMDSNSYREITLYYGSGRMETAHGWVSLTENDITPVEKKGRMIAPIEPIIAEMGGTCQWDRRPGYYDRLECNVNGHYIQLWPTQADLLVDNFYGEEAKRLTFDVVPETAGGVTMVQIDAALTAIDCTVAWSAEKGGVVIGYTT